MRAFVIPLRVISDGDGKRSFSTISSNIGVPHRTLTALPAGSASFLSPARDSKCDQTLCGKLVATLTRLFRQTGFAKSVELTVQVRLFLVKQCI